MKTVSTSAQDSAVEPNVPIQLRAAADSYVPSLDGLRTIAVGLVIAFHLSLPGAGLGFAGVDVFFVLSGYLITAGLLRDVASHGRPRYGKFWQRRFRRLLPAATLALLAMLAYTSFFVPLYRRVDVTWDIIWTSLYLGNWHFMGANSYFASDGTPSPLLHMWSLAVEEQFYFAWPLLIGGGAYVATWMGVGTTARRRTVAILAGVTAGLIAASAILLAVLFDPAAPDRAYMGTDAKAFEPLLGALLAIAFTSPSIRDWFAGHHRLVAVVGAFVGISVLPFLAGPSEFYFRGGAVVLSLAVALVIGALVAQPHSTSLSAFLSWTPMAYLGQISYGLYIWHWPWSVWLGVAHHEEFRMLRAPAALAGTLVCAVVSYHLVEQPIRSGRLATQLTPRRLLASVAVVMAAVIILAAAVQINTTNRLRSEGPDGLNTTSILVVGDSVPLRMMESLSGAAEASDAVLDSAARGGCPPLAIEMQEYLKEDHAGSGDCRMLEGLQRDKLEQIQPDIVFWWSRYEVHQRWVEGRLVGPEDEAFWPALEADLESTVDRLTAGGSRLVIAQTERPGSGMLTRCTPQDCHPLLDLMTNHDEFRRRWNNMVVDLAATDQRVSTFRMDPILCKDPEPAAPTRPALCDDSREGGLLRPDGSHVQVDPYGQEAAAAVLQAMLTASGA
ncbi:acyltransferase [Tessaracoccus sp. MC1679]|uniref:acyltransferase family protein n=1 Tax=Tessaracoccus sp. MC1679 TaxID=2760313 RepID=UPI001602C3E9|nr:acyltransferase [Tessaracoccus sp. MC1679]